MERDYPIIDGETSLEAFSELLLRSRRRCFIVRRGGRLAGLITPREGLEELAVVDSGELIGLVTRAGVAALLATRRELTRQTS